MEVPAPSDQQIDEMAREVDVQLQVLMATPGDGPIFRGGKDKLGEALPDAPVQRAAIEKATGEPFESFWQKYLRHARNDLCLSGGLLYQQWHKWKDLESKAVVRQGYLWLAAIGIPTGSIAPVAIAASVFLLNVVMKVGIDAICEDCAKGAGPHVPKSGR